MFDDSIQMYRSKPVCVCVCEMSNLRAEWIHSQSCQTPTRRPRHNFIHSAPKQLLRLTHWTCVGTEVWVTDVWKKGSNIDKVEQTIETLHVAVVTVYTAGSTCWHVCECVCVKWFCISYIQVCIHNQQWWCELVNTYIYACLWLVCLVIAKWLQTCLLLTAHIGFTAASHKLRC